MLVSRGGTMSHKLLLLGLFALTGTWNNESEARGPIQDAIESGAADAYNKDDCTWRRGNDRDSCPDPDVHWHLFTPNSRSAADQPSQRKLDPAHVADWLRQDYDPTKENIILVHGYAGGLDALPMAVLRDAYLRNGSYNVFVIDWGKLCAAPCYPAAVSNMRPVARCLAAQLTQLRAQGLPVARTTCVGHSLGAHVCGIMANYLLFRMSRIVALDPARPLIRPGLVNRIDSGDADFVQVIHTNAGYYGELGKGGHVDFCVNGGKMQPFCESRENAQLCSHVWAVCFMAQSVDGGDISSNANETLLSPNLSESSSSGPIGSIMLAEPCSRRCPSGPRIGPRSGESLPMGQLTPPGSRGSFCLTMSNPPYCPKYNRGYGDQRCCL